jgi:L-lactate dehydrogenase complex protein LldF
VKIDIPSILVHLRNQVPHPRAEATALASAAYAMNHPRLYAAAQRAARLAGLGRRLGRRLPPPLRGWTASRDLPEPPPATFRDWWAKR